MARKRVEDSPEPEAKLRFPVAQATQQIEDRIAKGQPFLKLTLESLLGLDSLENDYERWTQFNAELLGRLFTTNKYQQEYTWSGSGTVRLGPPSPRQRAESVHKQAVEKVNRLQSIRDRLVLIPLNDGVGVQVKQISGERPHTNRAFVVHGHDEAARESVARFLERLGISPVILHEQATQGRTLAEKLEHYGQVDFAIVLLTPDDVGGTASSDDLSPRARQNVILELGFFVGKLGRKNVCALHKGDIEIPSDYLGVGYVLFDAAGAWRLPLAKELKAAGFSVDMNLVV